MGSWRKYKLEGKSKQKKKERKVLRVLRKTGRNKLEGPTMIADVLPNVAALL